MQIWREEEQFVAHAMPLDVASAGETPEAARVALAEAVRLFLRTAEEHGSLSEVLEEAGYVEKAEGWESPAWVAVERHVVAA